MDPLDFNDPGVTEKAISDGADLLDAAGDADPGLGASSGSEQAGLGLLVLGAVSLLAAPFLPELLRYLGLMVSLMLGYRTYFTKSEDDTTFRYNRVSRGVGLVLVLGAVLLAVLYRFAVL